MAIQAPPKPNLQVDTEGVPFGKYRLLHKIATGGMAEIFLAVQTGIKGFERPTVIKRILPQHAANQEFVTMFLDEARIAATLNHPNITQIYEVGQVGDDYYIAMEYVHGPDMRSIRKRLRQLRRRLPVEHALQVIVNAASGLDYAHARKDMQGNPLNIIHRDISPQNVIVSYDGVAKVVDFGIAKASIQASETRSGVLKGKLSYMSPEQVRGDVLDRRSDVFAVGILLYEITTSTRLFKASSDFKVLKKIVEEPITPPSVIIPSYPPELERILMRALEKDREQRYQTLRQMQEEIEDFAREHRLRIGSIPLSNYITELFQDEIQRVQQATAEGMTRARALAMARMGVDEEADTSIKIELESPGKERPRPSLEEINAGIALAEESSKTDPSYTVPGLEDRRRRWRSLFVAAALLGAVAGIGSGAYIYLQQEETPSSLAREDDDDDDDDRAGDDDGDKDDGSDDDNDLSGVGGPGGEPGVDDDDDGSDDDDDEDDDDGSPAPVTAAPGAELAAVLIHTKPSGAKVSVDGMEKGVSPVSVLLHTGVEHGIIATRRGHFTRTVPFTPTKGDAEQELSISLVRIRPATPPAGTGGVGTLRVGPSKCKVYIGRKVIGWSPGELKVPAGKHLVRCVNPEIGLDKTQKVEVKAGKTVRAIFNPGS